MLHSATQGLELRAAPRRTDVGRRDALVERLEALVATTGGRWAEVEAIRPVADEVMVALT